MRKSYKSEIIKNENGVTAGFYFGYDWCAEHEYGIDDILKGFAVKTEAVGTEKKKNHSFFRRFILC